MFLQPWAGVSPKDRQGALGTKFAAPSGVERNSCLRAGAWFGGEREEAVEMRHEGHARRGIGEEEPGGGSLYIKRCRRKRDIR